MAAIPVTPLAPTPSIPKSIVEQVSGCQVLTYLIENGSKPGDNWMSVLYTVTAQVLPPGKSEPETRYYLFKCYPQHQGRQVYLNKTNFFHNELCFYSVWTKALVNFQTEVLGIPKDSVISPALPPFIGGEAVNFKENFEEKRHKVYKPLDNFFVMTDVRRTWGYEMVDSKLGLSFAHASLAVKELATIHALSWVYRQKVENNLLERFPFLTCALDQEDSQMWGKIVSQNVQVAVNAMNAVLGPDNHLSKSAIDYETRVEKIIKIFLEQPETAERECWALHRQPPQELVQASENEIPWRVICHGDTWSNNLLFKHNPETGLPEKVMLIDFQLTREGCPTIDLVYLLYTSTTVDFRRKHLEQTLTLYHDQFAKVCKTLGVEALPDFGVSTLKRKFHRSKVIGFMMAVTTFPMMLREDKKNVNNLEHVDNNVEMEDMFLEAFAEGAGGSALYKTRILEIAEELYEEGVI